MIKKGEWVRIKKVILTAQQRAPQVPDDTKKVPLEMWTKGFLQVDANIGDEVTVKTAVGRIETGTLVEVNPYYNHSFGKFVPELVQIDAQVKEFLFGGDR